MLLPIVLNSEKGEREEYGLQDMIKQRVAIEFELRTKCEENTRATASTEKSKSLRSSSNSTQSYTMVWFGCTTLLIG